MSISISEAELTIMKVLWQADEPVTTAYIGKAVEENGWKRTTISTFLTRLVEKGAATCEKSGNQHLYSPAITEESYRRSQTGHLISNFYNGSAKDLAAALFQDDGLSEEDIRELQAIIDGRKG